MEPKDLAKKRLSDRSASRGLFALEPCARLPQGADGEFEPNPAPGPESKSWAKACSAASTGLSAHLSSAPWAGSFSVLSVADLEARREGLHSPRAWAGLPGSRLNARCPWPHAQIPEVGAKEFEAEITRWELAAMGSSTTGRLEFMAFCVVHEAAHCLHAAGGDMFGPASERMDKDWLEGYCGASRLGPGGERLAKALAEAFLDGGGLGAVSREALADWIGSTQEGFADCWACAALWNDKEKAKMLAQVRDCKNSHPTHRTERALERLVERGDLFGGKFAPGELFDAALSASAEAAVGAMAKRLASGELEELREKLGLDAKALAAAEDDCSWSLEPKPAPGFGRQMAAFG